jgi:hypothetical protein
MLNWDNGEGKTLQQVLVELESVEPRIWASHESLLQELRLPFQSDSLDEAARRDLTAKTIYTEGEFEDVWDVSMYYLKGQPIAVRSTDPGDGDHVEFLEGGAEALLAWWRDNWKLDTRFLSDCEPGRIFFPETW